MNNHLRVAFHVPSGRLNQECLDTVIENVQRMALQQNKGNRPIFLLLNSRKIYIGEQTANDGTMDFVVTLDNREIK